MNAKDQANAVFEEFRRDAVRGAAKIANGMRGEVKAPFNCAEYKVVCDKGQVTCYIDGKKVAKVAFIAALAAAIQADQDRFFGAQREPDEFDAYADVPYNEDGINADGQNVFCPGPY